MLSSPDRPRPAGRRPACALAVIVIALLTLTGCLEQIQSTRLPQGALLDFLLHLQNGELDDARTYFAPGLVTPSAELDQSLLDSSNAIKKWEIRNRKATGQDLPNGERTETISGQVRPHSYAGTPTPGPDDGWHDTDIISATM